MKKLLFIVGLGGIGYALYNYFNKQLALALDWDFKIKDVKINELTSNGVNLDLIISVLNKSSFKWSWLCPYRSKSVKNRCGRQYECCFCKRTKRSFTECKRR